MAGAVAQYRVDVGMFDGTGGSMRARQFIRIVDQAIASSGLTVQRMAAIVQSALRGAAALWFETRQSLGTAGLDSWTTLRPLLQAQYCRQLTMTELAAIERQLEHRNAEPVRDFFVRCEAYVLEEDADVEAADRQEQLYMNAYNRRVKALFIKGLKSQVRMAMVAIDVNAATGAALLAAAQSAETLLASKPQAADSSSKREVDAVAAMNADTSEEGKAFIAAFQQRYGRGGGGRGGFRGRGGRGGAGRGAPQGPAYQDGAGRRPGPSREVLQSREAALCGKCNKVVKHRTSECWGVNPAPRGAGRGGGRGRGRSYASAAAATSDGNQEFVAYDSMASGNA
jgi:hypothetical protein